MKNCKRLLVVARSIPAGRRLAASNLQSKGGSRIIGRAKLNHGCLFHY